VRSLWSAAWKKGKTWNPITGCTRVSAGCDHCYAYTLTKRLAGMGQEKYKGLCGKGHFNGVIKTHDDALSIPLRRKKPTTWFVNSMSDLFHEGVPFEFVDKVFAIMALCPQHTFQILTKRPERVAEYLRDRDWCEAANWAHDKFIRRLDGPLYLAGEIVPPLPNVWLGTSVENQEAADARIPHLLRCPAAVRFLSLEPLLGEIDFGDGTEYGPNSAECGGCGWCGDPDFTKGEYHCPRCGPGSEGFMWDSNLSMIHWVITGGESGPGARPCNVDWIRNIIKQCKDAGVACFVKQLGRLVLDHHAGCHVADDLPAFPMPVSVIAPANNLLDGVGYKLNHPKGGDPAEWPEDLRVREMPT
jgi:protein gp37